jgi:hypothetical protein
MSARAIVYRKTIILLDTAFRDGYDPFGSLTIRLRATGTAEEEGVVFEEGERGLKNMYFCETNRIGFC